MRAAAIAIAGLLLALRTAQGGDAKDEIDFVTRAANGDRVAIAESRLALDRSHDPQVKAFAQRLIEEHGPAEVGLEAAAAGSGAEVPTTLDVSHQTQLSALQGRSGADFDHAYIADQAEVHSNALTLYADYMLLGDNAALKSYATQMIPIAQAQFKETQRLSGK